MKKIFLIPLLALFPKITLAHCPLCTAGAGALAVLAASLGVSTIVVGILIGAFSLALGMWLAPLVKKKYVKHQDIILTIGIFILTVVPIMPLIREYRPLYLSMMGEYGSLLHNTYLINLYILGAIIGAFLLFVSPYLSKALSRARGGKMLPFQGLGITFLLLIVVSLIVQFLF